MKTHVVKSWTTVENKLIPFSDMTHQHWSNIYWYHLIFKGFKGMNSLKMHLTSEFAKTEIGKRFDGEILEWKPVYSYEVEWLRQLGLLSDNYDIFDNTKKIGRVLINEIREV